MKALPLLLSLLASAAWLPAAHAADAAAAEELLKASKCMTCHSVDKAKDGPSFRDTAEKYRAETGAEDKLVELLQTPHTVEIDGEEEDHGVLKTRDVEKIRNLVQWILSH